MKFLLENFKFNFVTTSWNQLFHQANEQFLKAGLVKPTYLSALIERELNYPTGLVFEHLSVALPHVDSQHILKEGIVVYHLLNPIEFIHMGTLDQKIKNIKYIYFLLIKTKNQLNVLNRIILFLNQTHNQKKLSKISNIEEMLTVFKEI